MLKLLRNLSIKIGLGQIGKNSMIGYEILYRFLEVVTKPYTELVYHLECFKRACAYFKHGYTNYDFDYVYLIKDIIFKLKRMQKCILEGYGDDNWKNKIDKEIKKTIDLGEKYINYDYESEHLKKHYLKWGERKVWFTPCEDNPMISSYNSSWLNVKNDDDDRLAHKEFIAYSMKAEKERERDKVAFFNYIGKKCNGWWD